MRATGAAVASACVLRVRRQHRHLERMHAPRIGADHPEREAVQVSSSPVSGRWPIASVTRPPMVSYSSSGKLAPKRSLKSPIGVSASTTNWPSAWAAISALASQVSSCSSSIWPTICSSTSSIVT